MRFGALYVPLHWPKGVSTVPEVDPQACGTRPAEFAADLERLTSAIRSFAALDAGFLFPPHPIFGPLTRRQWMRWAWLHTDHHLRHFGA